MSLLAQMGARRHRHLAAGALVLAALLVAAWPRAAMACGLTDVGCQGDAITYNLWIGIARLLWFLNRLLLLGAYLLDILRHEVLNALDAPLAALTDFADSVVVAVAGLALTIALLLILVMPITGAASPFNVRQILVLTVAAPVILASLGGWLGDLDKLRGDLSQYIYSASAQSSAGGGVIGSMAASGEMGETTGDSAFLYPATGQCGRMLLPRYTGGLEEERILRPDEAAAAFLFATAIDIHCPELGSGPEQGLPQGFYDQPSPGYAYAGDIRDLDVSDRAIKLAGVQAGTIRLFSGLFVGVLALLFYIVQLIFTLALVALFVGLVFGLLFGFFRRDFGWLGEFLARTGGILQASWVASFLLGLLFAALVATARTGNAAVFAGLALGQIALTFQLTLSAFQALRGALEALAAIAGGLMGGANVLGQAAGMTGRLLGGAPGLLLGGVAGAAGAGRAGIGAGLGAARGVGAAALTAGVAVTQTRSAGYAMSAVAGRIAPIARLGEVASGMGLLPDEVTDGLRAGQRSVGGDGFRALNQRARADSQKYRPAAERRAALHQIGWARNGAVSAPTRDRLRQEMAADPSTRVISETDLSYPALHVDPDAPDQVRFSPRVRRADLPGSAVTAHLDDGQVHERLRGGERAQFNPDGTVTHWRPDADGATTTRLPRPTTGAPRAGRPRPRPQSGARHAPSARGLASPPADGERDVARAARQVETTAPDASGVEDTATSSRPDRPEQPAQLPEITAPAASASAPPELSAAKPGPNRTRRPGYRRRPTADNAPTSGPRRSIRRSGRRGAKPAQDDDSWLDS